MKKIRLEYCKSDLERYVSGLQMTPEYNDPIYYDLSLEELCFQTMRKQLALNCMHDKMALIDSTIKVKDENHYIIEGICINIPPSRLESMIDTYQGYALAGDYHGAKAIRENIVKELNLAPLPPNTKSE